MASGFPNVLNIIGIGESRMTALAVALKRAGASVTTTDDLSEGTAQILQSNGISRSEKLPDNTKALIVGTEVAHDDKSLKSAKNGGIQVWTFPQTIAEFSRDKQRIVIAGGDARHLIMDVVDYALNAYGRKFDHVKHSADGWSISLSNAPVIIIDGDEKPTSVTDATPVFNGYLQHIGILIGPFDGRLSAGMQAFADQSPKGGTLIYDAEDDKIAKVGATERADVQAIAFKTPPSKVSDGKIILTDNQNPVTVNLKSTEELRALAAARELLKKIGITTDQFYKTISGFSR